RKRLVYNLILIGFTTFLLYSFWEYTGLVSHREVITDMIIHVVIANVFYSMTWGLGLLSRYYFKSKGFTNTGRWVILVCGIIFSIIVTDVKYVLMLDVLFA
ncbi:MAG: hypothetical protein ACI837_002404, partial [Crocinitomicaceae bacterium]